GTDFDRLCTPLKSGGIPAYPVLGNHDYWVYRRPALANYFERFPHLRRRHWYAATYGPLGLVFLDSNLRWLPAADWREQKDWFLSTLASWGRGAPASRPAAPLRPPPVHHSRLPLDPPSALPALRP